MRKPNNPPPEVLAAVRETATALRKGGYDPSEVGAAMSAALASTPEGGVLSRSGATFETLTRAELAERLVGHPRIAKRAAAMPAKSVILAHLDLGEPLVSHGTRGTWKDLADGLRSAK